MQSSTEGILEACTRSRVRPQPQNICKYSVFSSSVVGRKRLVSKDWPPRWEMERVGGREGAE